MDPVVDKEERNQAVDNAAQEIDDEDPEGVQEAQEEEQERRVAEGQESRGLLQIPPIQSILLQLLPKVLYRPSGYRRGHTSALRLSIRTG